MRTIVTLLVGMYITRAVMNAQAINRDRERNLIQRKALEQFIQVNLPNLTPHEMQEQINTIINKK